MTPAEKLIDQVARTARLYQRGLLTAKQFADVTIEDLARFSDLKFRDNLDAIARSYAHRGDLSRDAS